LSNQTSPGHFFSRIPGVRTPLWLFCFAPLQLQLAWPCLCNNVCIVNSSNIRLATTTSEHSFTITLSSLQLQPIFHKAALFVDVEKNFNKSSTFALLDLDHAGEELPKP
jgi:hypothetical protein